MPAFADLGLSEPLVEALRHLGYESPTPIQEKAIPVLVDGRDVIGQAQTGTGKTAAFGLPLLDFVDPGDDDVQSLILTPTRELCIQVTQALRAYGERRGVRVVAVFGGAPIRNQVDQLKRGAQVVVGTVGRVMDLMSRHQLVLNAARFVVLDEADEMLDLGFLEDVETILSRCPSGRQTGLFSATMPPEIKRLAETWMFDPEIIRVKAATLTIDTVDQFYVQVGDRDKPDALARVLKAERPDQAIIFVRTKIGVDRLARSVSNKGVRVKALHGDMSQGARDGVMIAFKDGRERLLVATDIAARGLDISGVTHILNYDMPNSPDVYVHRIGRTGRVGRSGRAITFVTPRQRRELEAIERHAGISMAEWSPGRSAPARSEQHAPGPDGRGAPGEPAPAAAAGDNGGEAGRRARRGGDRAGAANGREEQPSGPADSTDGPPPEGNGHGREVDGAPAADGSAQTESEAREARRPRHTKPRRPADGPSAKLVVGAGRAQGLEPADVISAIVDHSHLDGEDIRNVRLLEQFSLVEVPTARAEEVVDRIDGRDVRGIRLRVEVARR